MQSGQRTLSSYIRDANKLLGRGTNKLITIEQTQYRTKSTDIHACSLVTNILNSVIPGQKTFSIVIDKSGVKEYLLNKWNINRAIPVQFDIPASPTKQYAYWYKWMLDHPNIHALCIGSPTLTHWHNTVRLAEKEWSVDIPENPITSEKMQVMPKRIATWLFKVVHQRPQHNSTDVISVHDNET